MFIIEVYLTALSPVEPLILESEISGMKKRIALLTGGFSGEFEVSMKSAETIHAALDAERFDVHLVEIKREGWNVKEDGLNYPVHLNDFSFQKGDEKLTFDYAYVIIHGSPGEDGRVQGFLEMVGIPYSTGSVLNMSMTFNKAATQRLFQLKGMQVAEHLIFTSYDRPQAHDIVARVGLPCFVKPTESGSSIGVSKAKAVEDVDKAIDHALEFGNEVIIESFLDGRELACGVMHTANGLVALPVTEIITQAEFFDYKAKYQDSDTQEVTPADISEDVALRCQELSRQVYALTGCAGIARVDFFLCGEELFLVEINTIPGMSKESLVPKQMRQASIDLKEYLSWKIMADIDKIEKT